MYHSRKYYHPDKYGNGMVTNAIDRTQLRERVNGNVYHLQLQQQVVESEEHWVGLGLGSSNEGVWWNFKDGLTYLEAVRAPTNFFEITFSLDLDRKVYKRSIYTVLDWLGDVGGLFDALKGLGTLFFIVYSFICGDQLEVFLLETVYKRENKTNHLYKSFDMPEFDRILNRTPFTLTSKFFHCLRSRKEKRIIDKGMSRANKELEVDHFIRTQKRVKVALQVLLTKVDGFLLRNHRAFVLDSATTGSDSFYDSSCEEKPTEFLKQNIGKSPYFDSLLSSALKQSSTGGFRDSND